MKTTYKNLIALGMCLSPLATFAANVVDLGHQQVTVLNRFVSAQSSIKSNLPVVNLVETSRSKGFNQTLHIRIKETYAGYPVMGGDAIIHIPNGDEANKSLPASITAAGKSHGWMNGKIYEDLQVDLSNTPSYIFNAAQAEKAARQAITLYQQKTGFKGEIEKKEIPLIIYMDNKNKAHWAFVVKLAVTTTQHATLERPAYLIDAVSLQVYQQWNDAVSLVNSAHLKSMRKSSSLTTGHPTLNVKHFNEDILGGGYGGNPKMGMLIYDGLPGNLPSLAIERVTKTQSCYFLNSLVTIINNNDSQLMGYDCSAPDSAHNNLYWSGNFDSVNDGYSPSADALYGGTVTQNMYQQWVKSPLVTDKYGRPTYLNLKVHVRQMDNIQLGDNELIVGDGMYEFYPLTSPQVIADLSSVLFTRQHSNLNWNGGHSAAISAAFGDMGGQAIEFYLYGKNTWLVANEITKQDKPLRYMDQPSKDCEGRKPGDFCSVDNVSEYNDSNSMDGFFGAGIFNRAFYLIATSPGWDPKNVFIVMAHANMNYWTSNTDFTSAACGVIQAAKDDNFDTNAVRQAFTTVGVDISSCAQSAG